MNEADLKPRVISLWHSHELNRVRRSGDQVGDSLHDWNCACRASSCLVAWMSLHQGSAFPLSYLFSFDLARHHFCAFDNTLDVCGNICPEGQVECPRLASAV